MMNATWHKLLSYKTRGNFKERRSI